jgi:hypothetical protein
LHLPLLRQRGLLGRRVRPECLVRDRLERLPVDGHDLEPAGRVLGKRGCVALVADRDRVRAARRRPQVEGHVVAVHEAVVVVLVLREVADQAAVVLAFFDRALVALAGSEPRHADHRDERARVSEVEARIGEGADARHGGVERGHLRRPERRVAVRPERDDREPVVLQPGQILLQLLQAWDAADVALVQDQGRRLSIQHDQLDACKATAEIVERVGLVSHHDRARTLLDRGVDGHERRVRHRGHVEEVRIRAHPVADPHLDAVATQPVGAQARPRGLRLGEPHRAALRLRDDAPAVAQPPGGPRRPPRTRTAAVEQHELAP